jgi:hypothetical protein
MMCECKNFPKPTPKPRFVFVRECELDGRWATGVKQLGVVLAML